MTTSDVFVRRLYITGPITHNPNYVADFAAAEEALTAAGYDVLNPTALDFPGTKDVWRKAMRAALRMMLDADGLAMLQVDGWDTSEGAKLEVLIGRKLGMPTERVDYWLGLEDASDSD